jgi:hypothetical protein
MKEKSNKGKLGLKEQGPVWGINIGIRSEVTANKIVAFKEVQKLTLNVILN